MRELALRAASSTQSTSERDGLEEEFQHLLGEIDAIVERTKFGDLRVLSSDLASPSIQLGSGSLDALRLQYQGSESEALFEGVGTQGLGSFTSAYGPSGGQFEIFTINFKDDANSEAGRHWRFDDPVLGGFYVWYNTGFNIDPNIAGRTGIRVDLAPGDSVTRGT